MTVNNKMFKRAVSMILCMAMLITVLPAAAFAAPANGGEWITTVADPATLTRPEVIYGDNTLNAGKITVGKSVSDSNITVNGQTVTVDGDNNFLVTISQSAQVMGLSSQSNLPVDVVFVLDTSGSMDDNGRAGALVTATNSAISTLMEANEQNRVAVVAFSSAAEWWGNSWSDWGGGSAGGAAANVLSSLKHYTGAAADSHLQWVNSSGAASGDNREYIAGRDQVRVNGRNVNAYRNGSNGGTNIQAGIAEGAKLLTAVQDTTYTDPTTGDTVTRIPFLIIVSDGHPTYVSNDSDWFEPQGTGQQGPGSNSYEGNGFIAAMTAAYYKGVITEHYYGDKASADNHCFVYTMGVEIDALDDTQYGAVVGDDQSLAQITLDPSTYATGDYAADTAVSYYRYGNTWNAERPRDRSTTHSFMTYWNNYTAGNAFDVRTDNDETYTFSAASIAETKKYVNGVGYAGGLTYNDEYFDASNVSEMNDIFERLLRTIQEKAVSVPTQVSSGNYEVDGYVTFTDPIGEYMEVKEIKGVIADGYFYQGASFAQNIATYGTGANPEFDAAIQEVVQARLHLSDSNINIADFAQKVIASQNQAYYYGPNDYDNSIVWWGNAYTAADGDEEVQTLGFADNDTIDYIESQKAAGMVPAGADYVCRSYFFYGEAGGANPNPNHDYLYFMVRVQRELEAPYRETVVISAPASLLSVERVLVAETTDPNGNPVHTATVEHHEPARVVYEVGLWDSIGPENVAMIVDSDYANEKVNGEGSVNYDPETDSYNFFTNDWDRSESQSEHHRSMAKATFNVAEDNGFYTYQEDTLLVDANGEPVTSDPHGTTAYYVREYYSWETDNKVDGTYDATEKTRLIRVDIPSDAQLVQKDGKWYIAKGVYTASTLVVNGDDTAKADNPTNTATIVNHPHRTGGATSSHYTVLLGNNGMLTMKANHVTPVKTVSVNLPDTATTITDDAGKPVTVGDVLTYTVEVKNVLNEATDITVTDYVPLGTAFVAGSAGFGETETGHTKDATIAPDTNNVLKWTLKDVPAGQVRYVSFQVKVTEAALNINVLPGAIENTAQAQLGSHSPAYTNTTRNPSYGKNVTDVNNSGINGNHGFKVGDTLVYHVRFHNNATDSTGAFVAADVTVTDKIPAGTTYVDGSATDGGVYDPATGVITWSFADMAADSSKVLSFQVTVNASAKAQEAVADQADGIEPATGEIYLPNTANIQIENDPQITLVTNTTENWADVGDMKLTKHVAEGGDQTKIFTLLLTESTGMLSGKYPVSGANTQYVEFVDGKASVSIQHGQILTIQGLPAGAVISVEEDVSGLPGWTPTYNTKSVTIVKGTATTVSSVSVTNTYTLIPLTLTLKGNKIMKGAQLPSAATFGVIAVPDSTNPVVGDPLTGEVTVDGLGEYRFNMSSKTFTTPGIYKYTISEINGGMTGVTYDPTSHTLMINVIDNGDGTMRAEAMLDGSAFSFENGEVTFTNTYVPEGTALELTANKTLSGRKLLAGEYQFQITDGTNTYKGLNDADGNIVFEEIVYTAAGTYNYTLSEVIPAQKAENVTYDTNSYTIQVVVQDVNGKLVPTVSVGGASVSVVDGVADTGVIFSNSFVPDDIPLTLVAKKNLKAYDPATDTYVDATPQAGSFEFRVVDKATGRTVTSGKNGADGNITFSTFYYSAAMLDGVAADSSGNKTKTFTYMISEVVPELIRDPNMLYDLNGHEIQATLTYAANGTMTVSVNGDSDGNVLLTNDVVFVNYANPDSVTVTPKGSKVITGSNLPAGLRFSFKVVPVDGTVDAAVGTSNATIGGGNSETKDITFTSMVYNHQSLSGAKTATYRYWIMESNIGAGSNGVTYDATRYLYQVTLSRDAHNRLVASEKYFALTPGGDPLQAADYTVEVSSAGIRFENQYNAQTHVNLVANKVLSGRPSGLVANEFEFALHRLDETGKIVSASEIDGSNDASGLIRFATLNYSSAMLSDAYKHSDGAFYFSYVMHEIKPAGVAVPGVIYDSTNYLVTIKVTQTVDGLSAEVAGVSYAQYDSAADTYAPGTPVAGFTAAGNTNVTFTNTYTAVNGDDLNIRIKKTLTGRDLRDGEFRFQILRGGNVMAVAANDANGMVNFSLHIPPSATPGRYEIAVREMEGALGGVSYDTAAYTLYLRIADDGRGNIVATLEDAGGNTLSENGGVIDLTGSVVFENTYKANETHFTPEATKNLTGRALKAGEFRFQIQELNTSNVYTGINAADGSVLFETMHYTHTGTHFYKITEINGGMSGIVYDDSVFYLKVVVSDDGEGKMTATGSYYSDEDCKNAVASVTFANGYMPADVPVQLEATKKLTGRTLQDKEFNFLVRENTANGKIVATGTNNADGEILFSTFNISAADMTDATVDANGIKTKSFTYAVMESDNHEPGIVVDGRVFTVTVKVTDDGSGKLQAQILYPNDADIVFENKYVPNAVELPLVAFKQLTGKNLKADEFTFVLKDASGSEAQTVTNDAAGVIRFANLKFTEAGTYVYKLTEKNEDKTGIGYDSTEYTITVVVTDDLKGNLAAAATYKIGEDDAQLLLFANTYTPAELELELEGEKSIVDAEGNSLDYALDGFEFEVRDTEGNLLTTATSDDKGKILFTGFKYTAAGEYRYLISEKTTDRAGYYTDPTVWCVHITVGYDADTGVLSQSEAYIHLAPESHSDLTKVTQKLSFVNTYAPAQIALTLKAQKNIDGRDLRHGEFSFLMVDNATGLHVAEARNTASGDVNFQLTYTKAGTYSYTVSEVIPTDKLGGVSYTTATYQITVEVTDEGDGVLKAKIGNATVTGNGTLDVSGSVIFNNSYKPGSVSLEIGAQKELTGKALTADMFSFQLVNKADDKDVHTVQNDSNGRIAFPLTFTEAGVYEYTLSEVQGTDKGVSYDANVYDVQISVTDDTYGNLHAVTHITDAEGNTEVEVVFHNAYTPAPATYTPEVTKTFEGDTMRGFSFVLAGEGFETQTKQNDADGKVLFDMLTFQHVGEYTFTVTEQADPNTTDVKWDENVYTLVLNVVDDNDGQLVVDTVTVTSENGRTDLVFRNVHNDLIAEKDVFLGEDLTVSIDGQKVQSGDILTYTVSYTNYTGKTGDVTITDVIPEHTVYVEGSADNGGVFADGVLTWNIANVAADATVTVSFQVEVTGKNVTVVNGADVLEGENTYRTNIVANSVPTDEVVKDVFQANAPQISIDGKQVAVGDELLYTITYHNSYEDAADVTVTDTIPQHTAYVEGSADNGGVFADGVLTWSLHLEAGESKTVTFRVKVTDADATIVNQATALEGESKLDTNAVTNKTPAPPTETPKTGDDSYPVFWMTAMVLSAVSLFVLVIMAEQEKKKEKVN